MYHKRRIVFIVMLLCMIIPFAGCRRSANGKGGALFSIKKEQVPVYRFEELMFGTAPGQLQTRLSQEAPKYQNTILNVYPQDPKYLAQVADMAKDPTMREIYDTIENHYKDLGWLQQEMTSALNKAKKLDDSIQCDKVITFASGLLDYTNRVAANESSVLISLDQYVVPCFKKYGYFQLPSYLVSLCTKEHIVPDAMASIARAHIVLTQGDMTLLDYMIAEGKVLYFLDQVLPKTNDTIKIRYTNRQWQWAQHNAGKVWAYWIQNNLLFEKDYNQIFNFVEDAPKTNAFGDSAPRMTDYIGWQIVKQYVDKTHCNLHSLFSNPNAREILKVSGWKPKR